MKFFKNGIEISDVDIKCLENDLLDIEDWILKAIAGKINNCKKRMLKSGTDILLKDPKILNIPANEDDLIHTISNNENYKNRFKREQEVI